ncbi:MAG: type III-B CRISPR module-associated protein Cmr5 [Enhydrobacter sp.]|nr:MAG: type III-B CRISPR module-associated protein Cmr5 [Enhydrobacter sp.]
MQSDFIERAKHARTRVADIEKLPAAAAREYLSAVRALPAEIRAIGLGQALATLLNRSSRPTDGFARLYHHLEHWLMQRSYKGAVAAPPQLLAAVIGGSNAQYRHATAEADAYLAVLKRLAEVFLSGRATGPAPAGEAGR